jgi:hypothetical protein
LKKVKRQRSRIYGRSERRKIQAWRCNGSKPKVAIRLTFSMCATCRLLHCIAFSLSFVCVSFVLDLCSLQFAAMQEGEKANAMQCNAGAAAQQRTAQQSRAEASRAAVDAEGEKDRTTRDGLGANEQTGGQASNAAQREKKRRILSLPSRMTPLRRDSHGCACRQVVSCDCISPFPPPLLCHRFPHV